MPPNTFKGGNREFYVSHIESQASKFMVIDGMPFVRTAEPALRVAFLASGYDGRIRSETALVVDRDARWTERAGMNLFRMTSMDRAMEAARAESMMMKTPEPRVPDIRLLRPSVFMLDDESPVIGWRMLEAFRAVGREIRGPSDARIEAVRDLLQPKGLLSVSWDDPRIPAAAEALRALLAEGAVPPRVLEKAVAALQAWDLRPVDMGPAAAIPDESDDFELPTEMLS